MANARVNVDLTGVKRKLGAASLQRGKIAVANQALLDMNRFVPKRRGELRASGHATNKGTIEWSQVYARAQFYGLVRGRGGGGPYPVTRYTTPGTGKRWDRKAKSIYANAWKRAFVKGAGL